MVIVFVPRFLGLWDPGTQVAELHMNRGDPNYLHTLEAHPPSTHTHIATSNYVTVKVLKLS